MPDRIIGKQAVKKTSARNSAILIIILPVRKLLRS